jgi:hypothetical protein
MASGLQRRGKRTIDRALAAARAGRNTGGRTGDVGEMEDSRGRIIPVLYALGVRCDVRLDVRLENASIGKCSTGGASVRLPRAY